MTTATGRAHGHPDDALTHIGRLRQSSFTLCSWAWERGYMPRRHMLLEEDVSHPPPTCLWCIVLEGLLDEDS